MTGRAALLTVAAYAALLWLGSMLETVGVPDPALAFVLALAAAAAALFFAGATATMDANDFALGRRPLSPRSAGAWTALQVCAVLAVAALATPAGTIGIALPVAAVAGVVAAGAILGPAVRIAAAPTVPDWLAARYGGRFRLPAVLLVIAVTLPLAGVLLAALARTVAPLGFDPAHATLLVTALAVAVALPGGFRTQFSAMSVRLPLLLAACLAPALWAFFDGADVLAAANQIPALFAPAPLAVPSAVDALAVLCAAAGFAALPAVLLGVAAVSEESSPSRAAGWAAAFALLVLAALGLFVVTPRPAETGLAWPGVPSFAAVLVLIAVALTVLAALLVTMATALSRDLLAAMAKPAAPASQTLFLSRVLVVLCAGLAAWIALRAEGRALAMIGWSLSLAGATLFPLVLIGACWRGADAAGALAGAVCGVLAVALSFLAAGYGADLRPASGDAWALPLLSGNMPLAVAGLPVGLVVTACVSLLARHLKSRTARISQPVSGPE